VYARHTVHSRSQLWSNHHRIYTWQILQHAFNPLVPVRVDVVLLCRNTHYIILVDVTQTLMYFDHWSDPGVHIYLNDYLLQMPFWEWLHQQPPDELFLLNILWIDEACFTCEGVFNNHIWAWDNAHATVTMSMKSISVSAFGLELLGSLSWDPYLLPDRLTAEQFSGNCSTRTVWICASSCEVEAMVLVHQSVSTLWGRRLAVAEHSISSKVERICEGQFSWHPLLTYLTLDRFFPTGRPE
jgi:hypothetical protein